MEGVDQSPGLEHGVVVWSRLSLEAAGWCGPLNRTREAAVHKREVGGVINKRKGPSRGPFRFPARPVTAIASAPLAVAEPPNGVLGYYIYSFLFRPVGVAPAVRRSVETLQAARNRANSPKNHPNKGDFDMWKTLMDISRFRKFRGAATAWRISARKFPGGSARGKRHETSSSAETRTASQTFSARPPLC